MISDDAHWKAEKKMYAGIATGIVGKDVYVQEAIGGELGYTKSGDTVYVARNHPLFEKLDKEEAATLRYGVCVHEALHQVFTNFNYMQKSIRTLTSTKLLKTELDRQMYGIFVNLVEDPAIESMASSVVGGTPLAALNFSIRKIYDLSEDFQKGCRYPVEEVINALIQFGDLGILKGEFSFQSARSVFLKIVKPFYNAMNETDPKKRIDAVFPIFAECSRLWAGYSDGKKEEMEKQIIKEMERRGKGSPGKEATSTGRRGTKNGESAVQKRRMETMKRLESEQGKTSSSQNDESGNEYTDKNFAYTASDIPNPPELSEKDKDNIIDGILAYVQDSDTNAEDMEQYYRAFEKFPDLDHKPEYEYLKIINRYAKDPDEKDKEKYHKIVHTMQDGISETVSELHEIFISDRIRKIHCESGRADMNRFASGKPSTRMFKKRRAQGHKTDMCVAVIGDHSGSMYGDKLKHELYAVSALSEIFAELCVPFYFFSFNVEDCTPVQTHFIRWDNTETERTRLVHFEANGNNFDSYSIRYATKLLEERPERHKILFVLSDGLPSFYSSGEKGIKENAEAVMEARRSDIDVIGFGIGATKKETFHRMYREEYYVEVKDPKDIFRQITNRLTAVVEGWE